MNKRIIKYFLIISILIALSAVGYNVFTQHYEVYELDYSPIANFDNSYIPLFEAPKDVLPKSVVGVNSFGKEKHYDVDYVIEDFDLSKIENKKFFELMPEENRNMLKNYTFEISYSANGEPNKSIKLKSTYKGIDLKPIIVSEATSTIKGVEALHRDSGTTFFIDVDVNKDSFSEMFTEKKTDYKRNLTGHVLYILNEEFVNMDESEMFDFLADDSSLDALGIHKDAIRESFDELPFELKEYAIFSGLNVVGLDFELDIENLNSSEYRELYGRDTSNEEYIKLIAAYYDKETNKSIVMNTSNKFIYRLPPYDDGFFNKYRYSIELGEYISRKYYNGRTSLVIQDIESLKDYRYFNMKDTLKHEFMHFIDQENREISYYQRYIDNDTLNEYRKVIDTIGYGNINNLDHEYMAYSASLYFDDPEYLKERAEPIYNAIEKAINALDYSRIDRFNDLVEKAK